MSIPRLARTPLGGRDRRRRPTLPVRPVLVWPWRHARPALVVRTA